ncbi:PAS domain-containing protein [Roseovarius arcticus]|uniref:PAS domain-containing protein n=1 Tax=Roseovarius arcticus TaxID=2547404 RepID=UPI001FE7D761|nr:PAS domain-containing protein [Roseovarius arcticus]
MNNDKIGGETQPEMPRMPRLTRKNQKPETTAALAAFEAYWNEMRRGAQVPRRSDIDPRGIEPLLSNAFIVERIAPGLARLRIAGSHLTDLMGMEVRGMPISAFLEPSSRDALAHHLVRLFDEPATVRLSLSAPGRPSAPTLTGTLLLLPLRSDLGDISRALGCLVSDGSIGRGPRRFAIEHAVLTPLGAASDGGPAPQLIGQTAAPVSVHPCPVQPQSGTLQGSERPYLRLIKS